MTTAPKPDPVALLDRVLRFIETYPDGWHLYPGQDIHGWILQTRNTIANTPKPRTADDERRDVLSFIAKIAMDAISHDRAYYMNDIYSRLERGAHEGAADR